MLDDDQTSTTEQAAPTASTSDGAPRRRRAARRPAGPPVAAEPPVQDPVAAAKEVSQAPTPPTEGEAAQTKPARTRKAATPRKKKAVAEVPALIDVTPADSAPAEVPDAVAAALEPVAEVSAPAAEVAEPAAEAPRTRRRRTRKEDPAPEPETTVQVSEDLASTIGELEKKAPRRRRKAKAETFGMDPELEPSQVLDSLAAAIAGEVASLVVPSAEDQDPAAEDDTTAEAEEAEPEDEAEAEEDSEAEDDSEDLDGSELGEPRRRRRRRGGRRRRRGAAAGDGEADAQAGEDESDAESAEDEAVADESAEAGAGESQGRRRRRRRRRGEEIGEADDDPSEVVVRVREPRKAKSSSDSITGIEGSTRMEAKKQRRREGRAAGRRRSPILSEAEFLARRESVDRAMLIRQAEDYSQLAVMEDGVLVEHYVDRASATSMIGNIYLGRVQNVLPSMEAAFIDIGRGRNAVLYAGEVDWDSFGVTGADKKVERVFKSGQSVLVQVSKDPVGAKGARLTSHISLPGRYIVYSPGGQLSGISRKLPENERKRLKGILDDLIGSRASVIVRTAAEGASEDELVRDVTRLKAQWEIIEKKVGGGQAPQLLYAEPDLTIRIVRDLFTEDFGSLVIDGDDVFDTVKGYLDHVAPHLAQRLTRWDRGAKGDIFDHHRVHEQVAKALERKVHLPSGGSLIIDRTEAMTVIDVNTGRFTGNSGNLEATVTSNNLEAAEEIVRQLRLRDIGGIIVVDFIDMVLPSNRELLLRRLVECLGRDRTRHQVAEVTSLGLVQMTRKKIGTGLTEAFTVACETCHGRGYHVHDAPVASQAPADGGERDHGRRSRQSKTKRPVAEKPTAVAVRTSPPPELASVIAATFATHVGEDGPGQEVSGAEPVVESAQTAIEAPESVDPAVAEVVVETVDEATGQQQVAVEADGSSELPEAVEDIHSELPAAE